MLTYLHRCFARLALWLAVQRGLLIPVNRVSDARRFGQAVVDLASLSEAGIAIAPGFALDTTAIRRLRTLSPRARRRLCTHLMTAWGGHAVLLQSSHGAVPTDDTRHAADSRPLDRDGLEAALLAEAHSILIQPGLAARPAGRITAGEIETSASGKPGQMRIDCAGRTVHIGRLSGSVLSGSVRFDLRALHALASAVESHFGYPVRLRWSLSSGRFVVTACSPRPATTDLLTADVDALVAYTRASRHHAGALSPTTVLYRPAPWAGRAPTPSRATLDLANAATAPGGSLDRAYRALGLPVCDPADRPRALTLAGRPLITSRLTSSGHRVTTTAERHQCLARASSIAAEIRAALPRHRETAVMLAALDLTAFTCDEVLDLWRRQRAAYLAGPCANAATAELLADIARQQDVIPAIHSGARPRSLAAWQTAALAARDLPGRQRDTTLRRIASHRATFDDELAAPRYLEIPGALDVLVERLFDSVAASASPNRAPAQPARAGSTSDLLALAEDARHEAVRHLAVLRLLLLDLDRRYALGGKIFDLSHEEIESLSSATADDLRVRAGMQGRVRQTRLVPSALPSGDVTVAMLEAVGEPMSDFAASASSRRVRGRGTFVAGATVVVGRACVVSLAEAETGADLPRFRAGDVLVTPFVSPSWTPLLEHAAGVVSAADTSSSAVVGVARSYGIAMIVGVPNAGQFRPDDQLTLHPDGRVTAEPDGLARNRPILALVRATCASNAL